MEGGPHAPRGPASGARTFAPSSSSGRVLDRTSYFFSTLTPWDSGHIWELGAKLGGFQVYDVSGFQVYGVKETRVPGEGEARGSRPEAATSLQQRPLPDAYDLTGMEKTFSTLKIMVLASWQEECNLFYH